MLTRKATSLSASDLVHSGWTVIDPPFFVDFDSEKAECSAAVLAPDEGLHLKVLIRTERI
jgi:hypothetical protein